MDNNNYRKIVIIKPDGVERKLVGITHPSKSEKSTIIRDFENDSIYIARIHQN